MNRLSAQQQHSAQNRNVALAVQRARQQGRFNPPQGAPDVSVGACGVGQNQGGWPVQNNGPFAPWDSQGAYHNIPQMAPNLGPAANMGLVEAHLLRAGLRVQAGTEADPTARREISFSLPGGSAFYIGGIASCNDCDEIVIHEIAVGGIPLNVVREVDAAFFNVEQCWCEIQIGCVTTVSPLTIAFSQVGTGSNPPFLNLMFVGTFQASFGGCGFPYPGGFNGGGYPFPGGPGPMVP